MSTVADVRDEGCMDVLRERRAAIAAARKEITDRRLSFEEAAIIVFDLQEGRCLGLRDHFAGVHGPSRYRVTIVTRPALDLEIRKVDPEAADKLAAIKGFVIVVAANGATEIFREYELPAA